MNRTRGTSSGLPRKRAWDDAWLPMPTLCTPGDLPNLTPWRLPVCGCPRGPGGSKDEHRGKVARMGEYVREGANEVGQCPSDVSTSASGSWSTSGLATTQASGRARLVRGPEVAHSQDLEAEPECDFESDFAPSDSDEEENDGDVGQRRSCASETRGEVARATRDGMRPPFLGRSEVNGARILVRETQLGGGEGRFPCAAPETSGQRGSPVLRELVNVDPSRGGSALCEGETEWESYWTQATNPPDWPVDEEELLSPLVERFFDSCS
ncbi:hypothetical protein P7C70_g7324, partial [Phenoliferia sp. Uapishka_3]